MDVAEAPDGGTEFDFWIGEWDVQWESDGEGARGTNRVSRILDGRVILEEFDGRPGTPLRGMSVTTYDPVAGWVQTWVDSQGNHWHFAGGIEDGRMILRTSGFQDQRPVQLLMVWDDIRPDAMTWRWERSLYGGRGWETLWRLKYVRRHLGPPFQRRAG